MYKSYIEDYASKELLRFSSSGKNQVHITQVCDNNNIKLFIIYLIILIPLSIFVLSNVTW